MKLMFFIFFISLLSWASDIQVYHYSKAIGGINKFIHRSGPVLNYPIKNYCIKNQIDYLLSETFQLPEEYNVEVFITEDSSASDLSICDFYQATVKISYQEIDSKIQGERIIALKDYDQVHTAALESEKEFHSLNDVIQEVDANSDDQYFYFNNENSSVKFEKSKNNNLDVFFEKKTMDSDCLSNDKISKKLLGVYCLEKIKASFQVTCSDQQKYKTCSRIDPYQLDKRQDIIITSSGIVLVGLSYFLGSNKPNLSLSDVNNLNSADVNSFDRFVTNNWNPKIAKASDILLMASFALPLALLIKNDDIKNSSLKYGLMYLETLLITAGLTNIVKNIVDRPRPFTYNPSAPMDKKLEKDGLMSLFSGHTSFAFATSIFFAKVFSDTHPNSKLKPYVWGSALVLASTVATMRVISGKHFLTDVIVGAIVGGAIGYIVPKLHLKKGRQLYIFPTAGQNYTGVGFILRL